MTAAVRGPAKRRRPTGSAPSHKPMPGLAARTRAADMLHSVLDGGKALDGAFEGGTNHSGEHAAADRALIQAIVLSSLRRLPTLDAAINACLDKPLHASAAKTMAILRIMAAQLLVMDMADHAAVTLAVEDTARRKDTRKLKGLVNAVGRRMVREKKTLLSKVPAHDIPAWLTERWTKSYGAPVVAAMGEALREQPAIDLSLKPGVDRGALLQAMAEHTPLPTSANGLRLNKAGSVERLPGYQDGTWWVQDYAASLPASLLLDAIDDPAKARILDLCAAPGGKTAQLAATGAQVVALDQSAKRMKRLTGNMARLKLDPETLVADALDYQPNEPFDAVLLDAPCSATGTLRRNPDIGYLRNAGDIHALSSLQAKLFNQAAKMVKPGGVLVYATCSLEPEEGEKQINTFLASHPGWHIDPIINSTATTPVPQAAINGDGTLRTLLHAKLPGSNPQDARGMDGFFIARLVAPQAA